MISPCLKETVVRPLLKKTSLDPENLNYKPVANIPFFSKFLKMVVANQLQAILDQTDYIDPFQLRFRAGFSTETASPALYDDL